MALHERFGNRAEFVLVYVREAHSTDGWRAHHSGWSIITDPRNDEERKAAAAQACAMLKVPFPIVVDTMDDTVAERWSAWPERLFVVDVDGLVAYVGGQGPWGYWPREETKPFGWGQGHEHDHGEPLDAFLERFLRPAERAGPRPRETAE